MPKPLSSLNKSRAQIMAVLNVTPDSFSDGGSYFCDNKLVVDLCRARIEHAIAEGATLIDVGGESTRPGAEPVSVQQELDRVLPVLEVLQDYDVVISVDTSTAELMRESAKYAVGLINDVRALQRDGAMDAAKKTGIPVCLMHMQGEPKTMQNQPSYADVLDEVSAFLLARIDACIKSGISRDNLLLDPGFGFGKTLAHNCRLLECLQQLQSFNLPVLVGLSRKSMIQHALGERPVDQRLAASLALAVMAVERGAWIVRTHDVQATYDAVKMAQTVLQQC